MNRAEQQFLPNASWVLDRSRRPLQPRWVKVPYDPTTVKTVKTAGDPEARHIFQSNNNVLVMTVGETALEHARQYHPDARQAIGHVAADGAFYVGVLPSGVNFGYGPMPETRTVAIIKVPEDSEITMGLLLPDSRMCVPTGLDVADSAISVRNFTRTNPGTPLFKI